MSIFAEGEEVVSIKISLPKLIELLQSKILNDTNYEVSRVQIIGEKYDSEEWSEAYKEFRKASSRLEEVTHKIRHK